MARTTGSFPDDLHDLIEGAVKAGVFESKSDALRTFAREYFEEHENDRVAAAIALYAEETISLGTAARLANVTRFEMRDLLRDHDVDLRIGPADMGEAQREIDVARSMPVADEATADTDEATTDGDEDDTDGT
jgi:predicted HTH domain antitoxin